MISQHLLSYLFVLIEGTINKNASTKAKLLDLETGYERLLEYLLNLQQKTIRTNYARSEFIIEHYHLPDYLRAQVRHLCFLFAKAKRGHEISDEYVGKAAKILCYFIDFFAEGHTPESLLKSLESVVLPVTTKPENKTVAFTDMQPLVVINGNHHSMNSLSMASAESPSLRQAELPGRKETYLNGVDNALTRILRTKREIFLSTKAAATGGGKPEETHLVKWVVDRLWPCFGDETEENKLNAVSILTALHGQTASVKQMLTEEQNYYISVNSFEKDQGRLSRVAIIFLVLDGIGQPDQMMISKLEETIKVSRDYTILIGYPTALAHTPNLGELVKKYYRMKAVYKIKPKRGTKTQE